MKNNFRHTISLLLALLVLVSTQSYSINSHYCGNILVDKSFVKPAKKCAMHQVETTTCAMHDAENHSPQNQDDKCCDDEFEMIQGQDELKHHEVSIQLPSPIFLVAFVYAFYFNTSIEALTITEYHESPPPLFQRDIHAFYQVYLI
jgi:hypothetical protein